MPNSEPQSVDILIAPTKVEVMTYTEKMMADTDGYHPAVLTREKGGAWTRSQ